jgi:7,8-dihydropterin-6-yl-methyl-4-(beta-D-ribofuranosyl)aminobenzene 5'-phosphate synthase
VNKAKDLMQDDILLVMGGFHDEDKPLPLDWEGPDRIEEVILAFKKQLRVRYVAPCHCCGGQVRSFFKRDFRKKCISISTGEVITLTDLK